MHTQGGALQILTVHALLRTAALGTGVPMKAHVLLQQMPAATTAAAVDAFTIATSETRIAHLLPGPENALKNVCTYCAVRSTSAYAIQW
jgi:hypothetical protein